MIAPFVYVCSGGVWRADGRYSHGRRRDKLEFQGWTELLAENSVLLAMSYWSGKNTIVVGASRGLGLSIARQLVSAGSNVILVARNRADLEAACHSLGPHAIPMCCDITDQSAVDALFREVRQRFETIDGFFHVAGKSARRAVLDTSADDFHQLMAINFYAAVRCIQQVAGLLMESKGHLVLIGSLASKTASRFIGPYSATKFALASYAQQLRLELSASGLHVLHVCPGPLKRLDAGSRYNDESVNVPASALKPGAGAKLRAIDPDKLAARILRGCIRREVEIIVPWKAKVLFVISQLSPRLGDWLLARRTES